MKTLIISNGRSGSKFLTRLIYSIYQKKSLHPSIVYEPLFWKSTVWANGIFDNRDFHPDNIDFEAVGIHMSSPLYEIEKRNFDEIKALLRRKIGDSEHCIVKINRALTRSSVVMNDFEWDCIIYLYSNPYTVLTRLVQDNFSLDGLPHHPSIFDKYLHPEALKQNVQLESIISNGKVTSSIKNGIIWSLGNNIFIDKFINDLTLKDKIYVFSLDGFKYNPHFTLNSLFNYFHDHYSYSDAVEINPDKLAVNKDLFSEYEDRIIKDVFMKYFYDNLNKICESGVQYKNISFDINNSIASIINSGIRDNKYGGISIVSGIIKDDINQDINKIEEMIISGHLRDAEIIINKILEKDDQNINALNNLVIIKIIRCDYRSAIQYLKIIKELDPNNEVADENYRACCTSLPKITIITPTLNQSKYIEKTIQSVIDQEYPNFEHIIVDGGSSDNTVDILKKYPHLIWISEPDNGQSEALNKGLNMASGEIIGWLNSDDYYLEGAFFDVVQTFIEDETRKVVVGDCMFLYENSDKKMIIKNRYLEFEDMIRYWNPDNPPTQPSIFFSRELIDEFGSFDESLHLAMDYDFWLRISRKYPFHYIPKALSAYLFHISSKSGMGTDWSHFYPEWHKVYQRNKDLSKLLPNTPLISVILPCSNNGTAYNSSEVKAYIDYIQSQRLKDIEMLVITNIPEIPFGSESEKDTIPLKVIYTDTIDQQSILSIIKSNAQGMAVHIPDPRIKYRFDWYSLAVEVLLNNPEKNIVSDNNIISLESSLELESPLSPKNLIRKSALAISSTIFSIIIPTYNRSSVLKRCLESIQRQTFPLDDIEVLICDDGSTDNTADMVESASYPFTLRYLSQTNRGPAAARNMGIREAIGKYLLFLNDDALLEKTAVAYHHEILTKNKGKKIAVLGTFNFPAEYTSTPLGYVLENSSLLFQYSEMIPGNLHPYQYFYTCNLSILREAVLKAGLFDEDFTKAAAEDIELGYRLYKLGYRVYYESRAVALHYHELSIEAFCKTNQVRGHGRVTLYSKYPELNIFKGIDKKEYNRLMKVLEKEKSKIESLMQNVKYISTDMSQKASKKEIKDTVRPLYDTLLRIRNHFFLTGSLINPLFKKLLPNWENTPYGSLTSIIILNLNGASHIRKCVESVRLYTKSRYELIIIDNGSTDDSIEYLRSIPDVTLIENKLNVGAPYGRNQGLAVAKGEYIIFMDNDTIVTEEWLEKFVNYAENNPGIGMLGPMSNYVSGPQLVRNTFYKNGQELQLFAKRWAERNRNRLIPTGRLILFCLFVKREVIDKIGGIDPAYDKWGWEDDDLSVRAQIAGYKLAIAEDIFIHHTGSQTSKTANINYDELLRQNWKVFATKFGIRQHGNREMKYDSSIFRVPFDKQKYFVPLPENEEVEQLISLPEVLRKVQPEQEEIPDRISDMINRASSQEKNGEYAAAADTIAELLTSSDEQALKLLDISIPDLRLLAANYYLRSEHITKAKEYFESALRANPESAEACFGIARCFELSGIQEGAKEMYGWAYKLKPEWDEAKKKFCECTQSEPEMEYTVER